MSGGGAFNAGNGYPLAFGEQIRLMVEVFSPSGRKSQILYKPEMPSSPQFVLDISNARERLGYAPRYDCRRAFEAFKAEEKSQRFQKLWGTESDYE